MIRARITANPHLLTEYYIKSLLFVEFCKVSGDHLVGNGVVLQVALDVSLVRWHVDQSVT